MILISFLTLVAVAGIFGLMGAMSDTDRGLVYLYPMSALLLLTGIGLLYSGLQTPTGTDFSHTTFNNTVVKDNKTTTYTELGPQIAGYQLSQLIGFTFIIISIYGFVLPTRFNLKSALRGEE